MYLLSSQATQSMFPPVDQATPEGLLAIGGDLSSRRLLDAYRRGIFPWYSAGQPILWWSPDPRAVLYLDKFKVSRSLRKTLRRGHYQVRFDTAFKDVITQCAAPRDRDPEGGTWITPEMTEAYIYLHDMGYAHSVETWHQESLIGGLYGLSLGRGFFGESMFSRMSDASKVALNGLVGKLRHRGYRFIDCQLPSSHVMSMGAEEIPRDRFLIELGEALSVEDEIGRWSHDHYDTAPASRKPEDIAQ